jgi:hypothetical protein
MNGRQAVWPSQELKCQAEPIDAPLKRGAYLVYSAGVTGTEFDLPW